MKENLIRSLRGEEGEVLTEYKDHLGYSTIGVGRLIDKRKGGGITKEESAYFQMGVDGLLGFKNTLAMIQSGRYSDAAKGMLSSLWAKQTPARAKRMSEQMRTGVWQFKSGF